MTTTCRRRGAAVALFRGILPPCDKPNIIQNLKCDFNIWIHFVGIANLHLYCILYTVNRCRRFCRCFCLF